MTPIQHVTHCCQLHGCKYGVPACPVVHGGGQRYACEWCGEEWDEIWEQAHAENRMYDLGFRRGQATVR